MTDRVSDNDLYLKLMNHNAWTNGPILDIDSLGASGSRCHLILANTQIKLGNLMTNIQLWDLLNSIGEYNRKSGMQRKEPIEEFMKEYDRLDKGGKKNYYFIKDLLKSKDVRFGEIVRGDD